MSYLETTEQQFLPMKEVSFPFQEQSYVYASSSYQYQWDSSYDFEFNSILSLSLSLSCGELLWRIAEEGAVYKRLKAINNSQIYVVTLII